MRTFARRTNVKHTSGYNRINIFYTLDARPVENWILCAQFRLAVEFIFPTEHIDLRHWRPLYHRKEEKRKREKKRTKTKTNDGYLNVACLQLFHSISLNQQLESVAAVAPALANEYIVLLFGVWIYSNRKCFVLKKDLWVLPFVSMPCT